MKTLSGALKRILSTTGDRDTKAVLEELFPMFKVSTDKEYSWVSYQGQIDSAINVLKANDWKRKGNIFESKQYPGISIKLAPMVLFTAAKSRR